MEQLRKLSQRVLVLVPIVMIILIFIQVMYITRFNEFVYSVDGSDDSQPTYMELNPRADSTSTWLKRDFEWKGGIYDLNAQTIDGTLYNNSDDTVNSWSLRIDILENCFINNAWCGTVEIHQYVGSSDEATQTLDLRDYKLDDITLDYLYDGDLLIPLKEGDYVIYYASEKDNEVPIAKKSELTMGVIFYYFDDLGFMSHKLEYTYHRKLTSGRLYILILVLGVLWLVGLLNSLLTFQIYKDAQKQLEMKKSGLMCLSDIYFAIYIIELDKDVLLPVVDRQIEGVVRQKKLGAAEQLKKLIDLSSEETYRQLAMDFCDLDTLPDRMQGKDSIVCEYISKHFGWSSLRFFAMDRIEDRKLDRVLFTIQIIDSEKRERDEIQQQILAAEDENRQRGVFLEMISDELLEPVIDVQKHNQQILNEAGDGEIKTHALGIERASEHLGILIGELVEYSKFVGGQTNVENEPFSLSTMMDKVFNELKEACDIRGVELRMDIGNQVPDRLVLDAPKLEKILIILVSNSLVHTKSGSITIGVYGRQFDTGKHIVFSVKDTGDGTNDQDMQEVGIKLASSFIGLMGSKLNIVSTPGDGNNFYFEFDL